MALSPKQRQKALEQGLRVNLSSADEQQYVPPTPQVAKNVFARAPSPSLPEKEIIRDNDQLPIDREVEAQPTTGRPSAPADGRP